MNWFSNLCRRRCRSLCLLASGALPEPEESALASHLTGCEDCRRYYDEIAQVTAPLAAWESSYSHLQVSEGVRMRWAQAVQAEELQALRRPFAPQLVVLKCWRELVWPCRRAWIGLAAAWLLLWVVNAWFIAAPNIMTGTSAGAIAGRLQFFEEQRRVLVELAGPIEPRPADRAQQPKQQPRSERVLRIRIA